MSGRRFISVVEMDIDVCSQTWGVAPCLAAFGTSVKRKCNNTFQTCSYTQAYTKSFITLKFIEPGYAVKDGNYMPHLVSVGGYEQEVNIAGFSPKTGALGVRASLDITFRDFPDRDTMTDKYWAERISGAAQTDEAGYDPLSRGSFWSKFRARNPNYAGRAVRVIQAHIDDAGALVYDKVRSYVIDTMSGPTGKGNVTFKVKDILSLVDDVKAVAPKQARGLLLADIDAVVTTATLTPAGIGNAEYPASGVLTIGSEIVSYSRVGDVLTMVRGIQGTVAASHAANDTAQPAYWVSLKRADAVIYELLTVYGSIPVGYIDFAEWQAEFNKWGGKMLLSATICKPTGVSKLIGEINQLGITIWWDETAKKIRIKLNHPPEQPPVNWSDSKNIISIETKDNDDQRATRIEIWTRQIDPTKDLTDGNFLRGHINVSVDAESPFMFDGMRTQKINCRWLNSNSDAIIKILSKRMLNRYNRAPKTYDVVVDIKDDPALTDVISLDTYLATDVTGKPTQVLTQVFYRADSKNGNTIKASLQAFQFNERYGVITENSRPVYAASSDAQKLKGTYIVGPSLVFGDGSPAYKLI